ncbi:MAG: DUF1007 family protein [Alphaproteobacteria bacterium]|nr:DUF1007 family protein [Alphaproteobacteria bacterium]
MKGPTRILLALLAALLLLAPSRGGEGPRAHPHVWILAEAEMLHAEGALSGVRLSWRFDEFFSAILYEDFDWNGDGAFTPDEVEAMRAGAFSGLSEVGWFTDIRADGTLLALTASPEFGVTADRAAGTVTYRLTLLLTDPVDPVAAPVSLSIYDPEHYVSLEFDEVAAPIRVAEAAPFECAATVERDLSNPLYFGYYHPPIARLSCARTGGQG